MKKTLLTLGFALGIALITNTANAQVNFTEDFDGAVNWTGSEFFTTTDMPCEGTHSYVSDLHGGFVPNSNDATISPLLGTSDGSLLTLSYNYKIINTQNPSQPVLNSSDWGTITVAWATSAGGPWTTLETVSPANHTQTLSCTERTVTFTPAAASQVYIRISTTLNNIMSFLSFHFDDITASQACLTAAPDADAAQTLCEGSTVADLEAIGDDIVWYAAETGGEPLAADTVLTDGTEYFASQIPAGGCESVERTAVTVDLTVTEAPQVLLIDQVFCNGATIDQVQVGAEGDVVWYASETSETPLPDNQQIIGGIYYASQVVNGCESQGRAAVAVQVTTVPAPTGDATQIFEHTDPEELPMIPVTEIEVVTSEGALIQYYYTQEDAENGENPLDAGDILENGHTYYVTQTIDGCESEPFAVTIDVILSNDSFEAGTLSYYPNPVQDVFTISGTNAMSSVEIYNVLGQRVLAKELETNVAQIDMSSFPAGAYIVKASSGERSKTIKIIKQ